MIDARRDEMMNTIVVASEHDNNLQQSDQPPNSLVASQHLTDAAILLQTYWRSMVCLSPSLCVCLCVSLMVTTVSRAKTAKPIAIPYWMLTQVDPKNHTYSWGPDSLLWKGALLGGVRIFTYAAMQRSQSSVTSAFPRTLSTSVPIRRSLTQSGVALSSSVPRNASKSFDHLLATRRNCFLYDECPYSSELYLPESAEVEITLWTLQSVIGLFTSSSSAVNFRCPKIR